MEIFVGMDANGELVTRTATPEEFASVSATIDATS